MIYINEQRKKKIFATLLWIIILVFTSITYSQNYLAEGSQIEKGSNEVSAKVSGRFLDLPDGPSFETKSRQNIERYVDRNSDDPTSRIKYKMKGYPSQTLKESEQQEDELDLNNNSEEKDYGFLWDDDILVSSYRVGSGQDMDEDESSGDLYAIHDLNVATNDQARIYKSVDGGNTWSYWNRLLNSDGSIGNPKIRVARDASGQAWVCAIAIYYEPDGSKILWMRKMKPNGTSSSWQRVTSDNVDYADLDADVGTGARLYCTWIPSGTANDIWVGWNDLSASGWQGKRSIFVNPGVNPYPSIAAGKNGTVGVAFIDQRLTTNSEIRLKRSTTYGDSWLGSVQVSNNSGGASLRETDIAFSRGITQKGWIFATFGWSTSESDNIAYYYSLNSGSTWSYGAVIGSGATENKANIRARKSSGSLTVAYNRDPGNSIMFTWASSGSPTNFSDPLRINTHDATGIWPPTAGWTGSYSSVLYSSFTQNYKLYFDWFGHGDPNYCTTPSYQPSYWNTDATIRLNNNCYNYANNKRTNTFAQPGRASGAYCSQSACLNCTDIGNYAQADGVERLTGSECADGETKIALVIWPGVDYHWYRLDNNGRWSHKPGGTNATDRDNSGDLITNPVTADRGNYTQFCGYYCSCSDITQGEGHEIILFMPNNGSSSTDAQSITKPPENGLKATIRIFSGRPDPVLYITNQEDIERISRCLQNSYSANISQFESNTGYLGYKGILVEKEGLEKDLSFASLEMKQGVIKVNKNQNTWGITALEDGCKLERFILDLALEEGVISYEVYDHIKDL